MKETSFLYTLTLCLISWFQVSIVAIIIANNYALNWKAIKAKGGSVISAEKSLPFQGVFFIVICFLLEMPLPPNSLESLLKISFNFPLIGVPMRYDFFYSWCKITDDNNIVF